MAAVGRFSQSDLLRLFVQYKRDLPNTDQRDIKQHNLFSKLFNRYCLHLLGAMVSSCAAGIWVSFTLDMNQTACSLIERYKVGPSLVRTVVTVGAGFLFTRLYSFAYINVNDLIDMNSIEGKQLIRVISLSFPGKVNYHHLLDKAS